MGDSNLKQIYNNKHLAPALPQQFEHGTNIYMLTNGILYGFPGYKSPFGIGTLEATNVFATYMRPTELSPYGIKHTNGGTKAEDLIGHKVYLIRSNKEIDKIPDIKKESNNYIEPETEIELETNKKYKIHGPYTVLEINKSFAYNFTSVLLDFNGDNEHSDIDGKNIDINRIMIKKND